MTKLYIQYFSLLFILMSCSSNKILLDSDKISMQNFGQDRIFHKNNEGLRVGHFVDIRKDKSIGEGSVGWFNNKADINLNVNLIDHIKLEIRRALNRSNVLSTSRYEIRGRVNKFKLWDESSYLGPQIAYCYIELDLAIMERKSIKPLWNQVIKVKAYDGPHPPHEKNHELYLSKAFHYCIGYAVSDVLKNKNVKSLLKLRKK